MTSSSSSAAGGMAERPEEIEEGGRGEVGSATAVGTESETAVEEGSTRVKLPVKFEFGLRFEDWDLELEDLDLLRVTIVAVGAGAVMGESVAVAVAFFFEAVFFLGGIAN